MASEFRRTYLTFIKADVVDKVNEGVYHRRTNGVILPRKVEGIRA